MASYIFGEVALEETLRMWSPDCLVLSLHSSESLKEKSRKQREESICPRESGREKQRSTHSKIACSNGSTDPKSQLLRS